MTNAISRALLGKIVDEVFGGAIEDASVIEEIYAVIKREDAALSAAEPANYADTIAAVKNFAHWHHLNEWTIKNGRTPSDSEIDFEVEAFRKIEKAVKATPASSVAVKASQAKYHVVELRQCAIFAADIGPSIAKAMTDAAEYLECSSAQAQDMAGWAFVEGDFVRKKSGSWWEGRVVGTYTTEQTPRGYAVQLDRPFGPVQIYPENALEAAAAPAKQEGGTDE